MLLFEFLQLKRFYSYNQCLSLHIADFQLGYLDHICGSLNRFLFYSETFNGLLYLYIKLARGMQSQPE